MIQYVYSTVLYTYMYNYVYMYNVWDNLQSTNRGLTHSIGSLWMSLAPPNLSHDIHLIFPWYSQDIHLVFPWYSHCCPLNLGELNPCVSWPGQTKTSKTRGDHSLVLGLALSLQCSERLPWKVKVKGQRWSTRKGTFDVLRCGYDLKAWCNPGASWCSG